MPLSLANYSSVLLPSGKISTNDFFTLREKIHKMIKQKTLTLQMRFELPIPIPSSQNRKLKPDLTVSLKIKRSSNATLVRVFITRTRLCIQAPWKLPIIYLVYGLRIMSGLGKVSPDWQASLKTQGMVLNCHVKVPTKHEHEPWCIGHWWSIASVPYILQRTWTGHGPKTQAIHSVNSEMKLNRSKTEVNLADHIILSDFLINRVTPENNYCRSVYYPRQVQLNIVE